MNQKRSAGLKRFAVSAAIALPITITLLFLMTRLILPGEQDPIVTRMIRDIELHRAVAPPEPAGIQVFELRLPVEDEPRPPEQGMTAESSDPPRNEETLPDESSTKEGPVPVIDWWAEARRIVQESDEEVFKRWLLEQGYDRYVTIMQGPLPITNPVKGALPPSQEDATGYMNTYGDMEIKVSENCVAQTQVAARLDISDFAKHLPMRVVCKKAPTVKFPFERDDRE